MQEIYISIKLSKEKYLHYYRGTVNTVVTKSHDGRIIKFPAKILQKFVTDSGVYGEFKISYDNNGKFSCINRV